MLSKIYVYFLAIIGNILFSVYWLLSGELKKYRIKKIDESKIEKYVYYASKPLQYINLRNTNIKSTNYNILILADAFVDAEEFLNRIKKYDSEIWSEIHFIKIKNHEPANFCLPFANIREFYTGSSSDGQAVGALSRLYLKGCKIYDYEEGIGNYRNNMLLYKKKGFFHLFKVFFYKFFGIKDYLDSSPFLSGVYLYFPRFNKLQIPENKRISFNKTFKENILNFQKIFNISKELQDIIDTSVNKKFLIIATDWSGEYNYTDKDLSEYDCIMIKFHPHIKDIPQKMDNRLFYITGNFCIELLVFLLSEKNRVTFRSQMSSASIYLIGYKNITIENIENVKLSDFYNELYHHIENYKYR